MSHLRLILFELECVAGCGASPPAWLWQEFSKLTSPRGWERQECDKKYVRIPTSTSRHNVRAQSLQEFFARGSSIQCAFPPRITYTHVPISSSISPTDYVKLTGLQFPRVFQTTNPNPIPTEQRCEHRAASNVNKTGKIVIRGNCASVVINQIDAVSLH